MYKSKPFWKSKVVWTQVAILGITIATAVFGESNQYVNMAIGIAASFGIYGRTAAYRPISK